MIKDKHKARFLAANKAYSSLQTILKSKQIHWNNKIRLYEILIYLFIFKYWKHNGDASLDN